MTASPNTLCELKSSPSLRTVVVAEFLDLLVLPMKLRLRTKGMKDGTPGSVHVSAIVLIGLARMAFQIAVHPPFDEIIAALEGLAGGIDRKAKVSMHTKAMAAAAIVAPAAPQHLI